VYTIIGIVGRSSCFITILRVEPIIYTILTPVNMPYTSEANTDRVTLLLLTDL
jgi:hypothetical protein